MRFFAADSGAPSVCASVVLGSRPGELALALAEGGRGVQGRSGWARKPGMGLAGLKLRRGEAGVVALLPSWQSSSNKAEKPSSSSCAE